MRIKARLWQLAADERMSDAALRDLVGTPRAVTASATIVEAEVVDGWLVATLDVPWHEHGGDCSAASAGD